MSSRKIMIVSGKGGTGKSMFTVNFGYSLADRGYRTLLIDMNMGMRSLDLYLNVQDEAIFDLYDVITGTCKISRALIKPLADVDLYLLAACQSRDHELFNVENLQDVLSSIDNAFDYIIMDCPPGIPHEVDICTECCDEAIIVLTADYAALRDADATEDYLIRSGIMDRHYVINRLMPELVERGEWPGLDQIDQRLKCALLGIIMEDENIMASTGMGSPIVIMRDTYIALNFDKMTDRLIYKHYKPVLVF